LLIGADSLAENTFWVTLLGVVFIAVMAWVSYRGIQIAHWLQNVLVGIQYLALGVLVVVALIAVAGPNRPDTATPIEASWFNPLGFFAADGGGFAALTEGMLLMIFIYWGWDTILSLNEETQEQDPRTRSYRRDAHFGGDVPAHHRGGDLVRRGRDRRHRAGQRGQRRRRVPGDQ
jgi:amino acid transporter